MKRRSFSREFKIDAAALILHQGYSYKEACESLGISDGALRNWVSQLKKEKSGHTPESRKALTDEHREIQQLKARVRQLETEKEILKKATALLMKEDSIYAR